MRIFATVLLGYVFFLHPYPFASLFFPRSLFFFPASFCQPPRLPFSRLLHLCICLPSPLMNRPIILDSRRSGSTLLLLSLRRALEYRHSTSARTASTCDLTETPRESSHYVLREGSINALANLPPASLLLRFLAFLLSTVFFSIIRCFFLRFLNSDFDFFLLSLINIVSLLLC